MLKNKESGEPEKMRNDSRKLNVERAGSQGIRTWKWNNPVK